MFCAGNGRSSSGSDSGDAERKKGDPPAAAAAAAAEGENQHQGPARNGDNIVNGKLEAGKGDACPDKGQISSKEAPPKEAKQKVPRFSRLFGRKISRSPSQVSSKIGEGEKQKSKKDKHGKQLDKKDRCSFKLGHSRDQKNASGTLSSEALSDGRAGKAGGRLTGGGDKKSAAGGRQQQQKDRPQEAYIPSPYSFPSPAKAPRPKGSETSGSGYDSGNDSGIVANVKAASFVRTKGGKGASSVSYGSVTAGGGRGGGEGGGGGGGGGPGTVGSPSRAGLSVRRRSSRSHCKSSGYESIVDSERSSVDSYQGTINPGDKSRERQRNGPLDLELVAYDDAFIRRLDDRWRLEEYRRLKRRQERLKAELSSAKSRIGADPRRWSYELHTEGSGMDPANPNFVEAFRAETSILDKRVKACQSHVLLVTSFDADIPEEEEDECHCGTQCEPRWSFESEGGVTT